MGYKKIDDIGDMKCATKVVKRGEKYFGTLRVDSVEHFDITAYCDSGEQAQELIDRMVGQYRKGLTQKDVWGSYVRDRFTN